MRKLICYAVPLLGAAAVGIGVVSFAALPPLPPEQLQRMSSHIVVGKAVGIYTFVDKSDPDLLLTHGIAELKVEKVEKGKYDSPLIYVRFLYRGFRGKKAGWTGDGGHRGVPEIGEVTRVYLRTDKDGAYSALSPNGFTKVKSESK